MVSLQEIVTSATSAIGFLVCVGLASPTGKCPNGHSWAIHCPAKKGFRPYFWCRALLLRRAVDGKKKKEKMRCMAKGRLTANSPLLNWLSQLSPEKIVELIYHFSQAHTITEVVHETSASHTAVADAYRVFRTICSYMDWCTAKKQLGGPNKVVLVEESFLTRRKRNKGGFRGRTTQGHLTVIFGAVEMTKNEDGTHKETGRAILRVIPNKETLTLARIVEKNIFVEPDDTELFTPEQVVNTNRCEARVWGAGWGGQCQKKKAPECRFCGMRKGDGGPSHGAVDGPIPPNKLKSFRTFRLKHGPPPQALLTIFKSRPGWQFVCWLVGRLCAV